jgi:hypothetical protein
MSYEDYKRMCARKKRFRTEAAAGKLARKYNQRAYECPCCGKVVLWPQEAPAPRQRPGT